MSARPKEPKAADEMAASKPISGCGAIVLCGGKSSRMGEPKAWLPFEGEPLLARVVRRVSEVTWPVVLVAAEGQWLPKVDEGAMIVRDRVPENGPLEGLCAGFNAQAERAKVVFVCTTDAPFIGPALIVRLANLLEGGDWEAVVPMVGGVPQPLAAMYRIGVLRAINGLLAKNDRRVRSLLSEIRVFLADEKTLLREGPLAQEDPQLLSLRSVNTKEEYEAALGIKH